MADVEPIEEVVSNQVILSTALHHLDLSDRECRSIALTGANSDLSGYLGDLLKEINVREQKRAYTFASSTTEFYTCLLTFSADGVFSTRGYSENIAKRLLLKEIQTDSDYGHLSTTGAGHVKKGSFLQFLFNENGIFSYLGVKIEHQSFLDENDLKKKVGLSIENKIYKACKVSFDQHGVPVEASIFDTNSKPAVYWWKDFLELAENRGDAFNTRTASTEVVRLLNGIKRDFPVDHTILRNATIAAFKKDGVMKFDVFIKDVFSDYVPDNVALKEKLPKLIKDLEQLPVKKKFDSMFSLVPGEVAFKKTKVELTKEITVSYDDGIQNLEDKIWSEKSSSGKKLVVIASDTGFERFKLKERKV